VELGGEFCVLVRDCNSRDPHIREGDAFEAEMEVSGWAWGRNSLGDYGWVPMDRIEPEREGSA
jgi:hypothetical protein